MVGAIKKKGTDKENEGREVEGREEKKWKRSKRREKKTCTLDSSKLKMKKKETKC